MKKILIVEDDEALSRELSVLLTGAGYETSVLKNYDRALEEIREAGADLILLDITLPGVNGEELLRRGKQDGKGLRYGRLTVSPAKGLISDGEL